jgi:hypothetical protein
MFSITSIDLFYKKEQGCLLAHEPDGTIHEFRVEMLREAKELFTRYDEAHFHEEDNLDDFHDFCEKMSAKSPEVKDVDSPYLN